MPLTEKWPHKLWAGKGKEPESASMMEHVDVDVEVPHRPPPPPPLRMPTDVYSSHEDPLNPYEDSRFEHDPFYISSPEGVTSPPTFADSLMAASPISPPPPLYAATKPAPLPQSRLLTRDKIDAPVFEPEKRYSDTGLDDAATLNADDDEPVRSRAHTPNKLSTPQPEEESEDEDIPDQPPLILITGASSGLGLALFKHFAAQEPTSPEHHKYDVLGIDRTAWRLPGKGFQWQVPVGKSGKYVQLDITHSPKRLDTWATNFLYSTLPSAKTGEPKRFPRPVSLLIHCMPNNRGVPAAETLDAVDAATMRAPFDASVIGTLQLMQTVIPHLQLHADAVKERQDEVTAAFGGSTDWLNQLRMQGSRASLQISRPLPPRDPPARAVVLSSDGDELLMTGLGSGVNGGGRYAYRASKAALNAVLRNLSIDVPDLCFASVDMGSAMIEKPPEKAPSVDLEADRLKRMPTERRLSGDSGTSSLKRMPTEKGTGVKIGTGPPKQTSTESGGLGFEQTLEEELLPLLEKLGDGLLTSGCFVDRFGDPATG